MRRPISLLVFAFAIAGCGAFKDGAAGDGGADDGSIGGDGSPGGGSDASGAGDGNPSGGSDASGSGDDGSASDSGGISGNDAGPGTDGSAGTATGAGPLGDLPSGYCCTLDTDCRNRHCADLGGGIKMCEDECDGAQSLCDGLLPNFTCTASGSDGFCTPPSGTTTCVPAAQYVHGTKADGACCSATGNATAGQECLGGNCGATGDTNPFVCENACTTIAQCPQGNYQCLLLGEYGVCVPAASTYTCQ